MRDEAQYWWSDERHKVEIAEAYRMGWENAKEECARVVEGFYRRKRDAKDSDIAAAIRALKGK